MDNMDNDTFDFTDDEHGDVIRMIMADRQAKGEEINKLIVLKPEEYDAAQRKRFEMITGRPYVEEEPKKYIGNKIMPVILLVFMIIFFLAFFLDKNYLIGVGFGGMIFSFGFLSTTRVKTGFFTYKEKETSLLFRLIPLAIGAYFIWSAIAQAINEEPALVFLKIFHAKD